MDLHKQIDARHGVNSRVDELKGQLADLTNDFCELKAEDTQLKQELHLIKSVVIKKDKEISELKDSLLDQRSRNMKNNLLLHNVSESQGEDCEETFKTFLRKELNVPIDTTQNLRIERAHRMAQKPKGNRTK